MMYLQILQNVVKISCIGAENCAWVTTKGKIRFKILLPYFRLSIA